MELRRTFRDYCMENGKEDLLNEWHPTKNSPLTPDSVTYGSRRKIWWSCPKGHEWQAAMYTRTGSGTGCPYCAGLKVWPGGNDLASERPDLAAQWHPTKNGKLTPDQVVTGSHKAVWWVCEKGHEWRAMVVTRTVGSTCPYCANRALSPGENDLASAHPELIRQWHPTKNGKLTPRDVMSGSRRKVWWRCEYGHEWQAAISSRAAGAGCPVCAGRSVVAGENDLASRFPEIAAQWHGEKNGILLPESISSCSNQKVWWRCELGHVYAATVSSRTMHGSCCPYCTGKKVLPGFNDLATLEPKIAAQWHPTLNGTLTPEMVTLGSHRKVWWQCPEGHVWKAVVYSRAGPQKCGCPVCAGKVKRSHLYHHVEMTADQKTVHRQNQL